MNDGLSRDTPLFLFIHFLQPFSCNHENDLNKASKQIKTSSFQLIVFSSHERNFYSISRPCPE